MIDWANPADEPQIVELLGLLFDAEPDLTVDPKRQTRAVRYLLRADGHGILVDRRGPLIAGMMTLVAGYSTERGGPICRVEDLVVRPDHRGQGVGGALLDAAIAWARSTGAVSVVLESVQGDAARRLYERRGFRTLDRIPMKLCLGSGETGGQAKARGLPAAARG